VSVKTPKDREIYLPDEIGVMVSAAEVPEDVRRPAERAARKAANKYTRGVKLRFARPELEEEVKDRHRFERDNREALEAIARDMGCTAAEVAYLQLARVPEMEGARTGLEAQDAFYERPDSITLRSDTEADAATVAYLVAVCYRRAEWDLRGRGGLARRGKLKSADMEADIRLYGRDLVSSGRPW
jgi:hypothetical protein